VTNSRHSLSAGIRERIIRNVVDEDEKQGQTAKQIKPEVAPAPLMGIRVGTAAATVHRKNIAMHMADNSNAHNAL
jgi:hypothetical protein